jgi:ADP-heptose:LPS heptosyltransferase
MSEEKRKTALMLRAGGLGDCVILTVIARELNKRGYDVDYFVGSPTGKVHLLLEKLPFLRSVKPIARLNGIDCIEDEDENGVAVDIMKKDYDEVFDFKFSVEDNRAGLNSKEGWRSSINSNYTNWIDLSLAWANIDPTFVEDKCPVVELPDKKYSEWAQAAIGERGKRPHKVVGIQLQASSLTRTWYKAGELPEVLHQKYPDDIVLIFADNAWFALTSYGKEKIEFPAEYDPLCCSTALIKEMDVFISADSGTSHIAEAVGTHTIGIYTTVPSWTRVRDYKHAHPIDALVLCHPCFVLDVFCPLERKRAAEQLNERQQDIINGGDSGANVFDFAKKYNTVPKAIIEEYNALKKQTEAMSAAEPACVKSITTELILAKLGEIYGL